MDQMKVQRIAKQGTNYMHEKGVLKDLEKVGTTTLQMTELRQQREEKQATMPMFSRKKKKNSLNHSDDH